MSRSEAEVQAGVLAYLATRPDVFFWRQNTGGAKLGDSFVRFGVPGIADVLGVQSPSGKLFAVEVKREKGGKLSPDQKWWGDAVTAHGGLYVVARSIDDVRKVLGEPMARVAKVPRRKRIFPR